MLLDARATIASSRALLTLSISGLDEIYRRIERSHATIAESRRRLDALGARAPEPKIPVPRNPRRQPKRNKLSFKDRWLISVNVVAALRRAGVVCDIVVADGDAIRALTLAALPSPKSRH
jgi:hypothetical protein